jgi:hypothetical protein
MKIRFRVHRNNIPTPAAVQSIEIGGATVDVTRSELERALSKFDRHPLHDGVVIDVSGLTKDERATLAPALREVDGETVADVTVRDSSGVAFGNVWLDAPDLDSVRAEISRLNEASADRESRVEAARKKRASR